MFKNSYLKKSRSEIEPEEILLDRKLAMKLETPLKNNGFLIIFTVSILILGLFWGRAFWLQIKNGDYYTSMSNKNSIRFYHSRPPRGIIYDINHQAITSNTPDFSLLIIPADLPARTDELNKWISQLAKIIKKDNSEIENFIKSLNKNSTEPALFKSNLDRETLMSLETNSAILPAIFINKETRRDYNGGGYFSHIIGYVGKVTGGDLKTDSYYGALDFIGKDGLEAQYEKELRGSPGKIAVSVNSENTILKTLIAKEAAPGNNLILSIDGDLQKFLTNALNDKIIQTNSTGAAAVVLNVKSGEIIALVSLPSFDFNSQTYGEIIKDKNKPLFNRAIGGFYPAGSTIKPFVASAALAENIIDPNFKIDDTLGYIKIENQYDPNIVYTYRDWKAHGFVDMRRAIAVSANVYFYIIGGGYKNIKVLGIDRIKKYLNIFGFGSDLGIDLPGESSGLIPDPAWKKSVKNEGWFTGDTYNVSIGQGDTIITPLQLASAIGAVANGGTLWKPKLVLKITDHRNNSIREFKPESIRANIVDESKLKVVREGLRKAVTEGSAYLLNDLPIKVAGKTGTAQITNTFRKTNAWFTGFAPYDNPEIALAIIVEGAGEGSTAAVPVAKEVFYWYYNKNYDKMIK
ncbi:MAG: Peptidoglycan glycosyltransferase [Candidatus Azambacteria bacterium GW2011_GWA2_39_10]|uniref:Peptidoglycan glycosyltransferase n=1 Tax=Candidatus Azambacteria bacterium GW2011_GWA2_39_10 TaxID=1618611 RepID=A0A0G0LK32_9BACT|nr:MAG: Peptidoglycan glycosyltransferase [Candidatus Azambacteria bacterium GW2011_GWA2_39_10]